MRDVKTECQLLILVQFSGVQASREELEAFHNRIAGGRGCVSTLASIRQGLYEAMVVAVGVIRWQRCNLPFSSADFACHTFGQSETCFGQWIILCRSNGNCVFASFFKMDCGGSG